jgi:hypothetical protein
MLEHSSDLADDANLCTSSSEGNERIVAVELSLLEIEEDMLSVEQRQAYEIVAWHLDRTISGESPLRSG